MKHDSCLITGGTGTFGSSYTIMAIKNKWHKKITIFSRDEYKQLKLSNLLKKHFANEDVVVEDFSLCINGCQIRFFIGDIRNKERVSLAFNGVDLVIHTAALKHVPVCEYNIEEALSTNVDGTLNVIKSAHEQGVKNVISLSTDKAVDPINLYGASKMCLEKITMNHRIMTASDTSYSVVRYGNVIGSRGSLIERLCKDGENISITDGSMTRFWITIEKAIDLVRLSLDVGITGSLMIPPMKALTIDQTFKFLKPELKAKQVGKRPGEKKHEKILSEDENNLAYFNKDFTIVFPNTSYGAGGEGVSIKEFSNKKENAINKFNLKPAKAKKYSSDEAELFSLEDFVDSVKSTIVNII